VKRIRRTRVNMIELRYTPTISELKLEVESVMTSAYEADVDMSSYRRYDESKLKLKLNDYNYPMRNSIVEHLVVTGLYRKAFESFLNRGALENFSGKLAITMRKEFSPKSYRERLLWFDVRDCKAWQIDFSSTQANIPVLI